MVIARFTIHELPPKRELHHMVVYNAKKRWADSLGWQMRSQRIPPAPPEKRLVIVEFFRPSTQDMDEDNLYSRLKVPLDAMSRAHGRKKIGIGVIWDDSPEYLDVHPFCVNWPKTKTVITVCTSGDDPDTYRYAPVQLGLLETA